MIDILSGYTFLIVAFGTVILAFASGIIGTVSVIKGQSLIGDAVGHATFPGIVIAFMLVGIRDTLALALGALILGIIAFLTIQLITEHSKITLDSALALVLSSFFGLGMALMSFVQGNPDFDGTQGLSDYIFGQAAYMLRSDVYLIIAASILSLLIFSLFYQQIKIYIFDPIYSRSIGISNPLMNFMVLGHHNHTDCGGSQGCRSHPHRQSADRPCGDRPAVVGPFFECTAHRRALQVPSRHSSAPISARPGTI